MASIGLPELTPRQYTYLGAAFAVIGFLLTLLAIAMIIFVFDIMGIGFIIVTALAMGALLVATLSFHKLGKRRIAV